MNTIKKKESYQEVINNATTSREYAEVASKIKKILKDDEWAEQILNMAIDNIHSFDDGLFVQPVVKYTFPEVLPSFAPLMLNLADTVEELLYANDLYLAHENKVQCQKILKMAEKKALCIYDYLQLCSSIELLDPGWAVKIYNKAEDEAEIFEDYIMILNEGSYFYSWPKFLNIEKVKKLASNAVSLAEKADDFKKLSDFFIYYRDKLDPSIREKRLKKIISG